MTRVVRGIVSNTLSLGSSATGPPRHGTGERGLGKTGTSSGRGAGRQPRRRGPSRHKGEGEVVSAVWGCLLPRAPLAINRNRACRLGVGGRRTLGIPTVGEAREVSGMRQRAVKPPSFPFYHHPHSHHPESLVFEYAMLNHSAGGGG